MSNGIQVQERTILPEREGLDTQWLDVTVSGLVAGQPPRLAFFFCMNLRNGATKHCSMVALVPDRDLQQRLLTEGSPGTKLRVCIETDWDEDDIPTILKDFCFSP